MSSIISNGTNIIIEVDQGKAGRGITNVTLVTIGADYYLEFDYTDGTTEQVGPIATVVTELVYAEVRNAEAVTILKGQPVYLYQAQGNLATVKLAYNTSDATSSKTLGLAAENIAGGAQGLVLTQGTLNQLDTSAYAEGDTLYLGAAPGTLTAVKPKAPNHLVYIGVVERANAGAGQIYVRVQNGFELDEIHDVQINSPANGQTIIYDAATDLWKNANLTAGTGITIVNGPGSVTISAPQVGTVTSVNASGGTTGLTFSGGPITASGTLTMAGTLGVANGGTGVTTSTGTGSVVLSNSPALTTPNLGTPSAATLTNATGLPVATGISGLGAGIATFLATPSSANLAAAVTDETGSGSLVFATSPTLATPALGAATATSINGLTVSSTSGTLTLANGSTLATSGANSLTLTTTGATNVTLPTSGTLATTAGTVASFSAGTTGFTPSTATSGAVTLAGTLATTNGGTGLTNFTANGVVYASSTSALTTGSALTFDGTTLTAANFADSSLTNTRVVYAGASGNLTDSANFTFNGTDLTVSGAVNAGSVNATTLDLTNIEVTNVKAKDGTSAATIADSTGVVSFTANPVMSAGTANGVMYLNGSKVATTGSALTFDGSKLVASGGNEAVRIASGAPYYSFYNAAQTTQYGYIQHTGTDLALVNVQNGAMPFYVNNTEQMRLTSTGLGIGTSSPNYKLDVQSPGAATINVRTTSSGNAQLILDTVAGGVAALDLQTAAGLNRIIGGNGGTSNLGFYTASTLRATIDASGNLGIGTSSPSYRLDVRGTSTDLFQVKSTGAYTFNRFQSSSRNWALSISSSFDVYDETAAATRMSIDSSGNLGLGVTPSAWKSDWNALDIETGGVAIAGALASGAVATNAFLNSSGQWVYKSSFAASRYAQVSDGSHQWHIAPSGTAGNTISFSQAMTLDASGNLLVGNTSQLLFTTKEFNVNAASGSAGFALATAGSARLYMTGSSTDGNITTKGSIPLLFGTNEVERARITSGGYSKFSNDGTYINGSGANHEMRQSATDIITYFTNKNGTNPYGIEIDYTVLDPNGTGNSFFAAYGTTTLRAQIRSNGGIVNYQANDVNLSDRREKTNFAPAKSYLDTICSIPVQTFNYIDQSEDDPGLTLGVVAQDVQEVAPELVMESNWGTAEEPKQRLSIYQTDLQYALMKCVQELKAELDSVKAELATLKGQP